MIYFSITLLTLSLWLIGRIGSCSAKMKVALVTLSMLSSVLIVGYLGADYFTGKGVDESVIYHVFYGLDGAGFGAYSQLILAVVIYFVISFTLIYLFLIKNENRKSPKKVLKNTHLIGLLVLAGSILFNPVVIDLYRALRVLNSSEFITPSQYIAPTQVKLEKKKNIIYLYLEGVERTYFNQDKFPGLMPNLMALEKQSISFENIEQTYGTGWTIAGMVASQCGLPLARELDGNAQIDSEFLPGAFCLGDALKANGYHLEYIGGAPIKFAGKGNFYRTHQFSMIGGKEELKKDLPADVDLSGWGLHDEVLYKIAKQKIDALNNARKPYGLFMLTLDTHPPDGYLGKNCDSLNYGDGEDEMLNALHCADKMAADFVRSILFDKKNQDTIVVVASDHLAMKSSTWNALKNLDRRNLLMIFDAAKSPMQISRIGSSLDVTPTLLNLLGVTNKAWAFGRDMLGGSATLAEQMGKGLSRFLSHSTTFIARSFWGHGTLLDGILVDSRKNELVLGDKTIAYPALIKVNGWLGIDEVISSPSENQDLRKVMTNLSPKSYFIWVDQCSRVEILKKISYEYLPGDYCVMRGRLGSRQLVTEKVTERLELQKNEVESALKDFDYFPQIFQGRRRLLARASESKNQKTFHLIYPKSINTNLKIRSAGGYENGQSYIASSKRESYFGSKRMGDFYLSTANRGITIVGFDGSSRPIKLAYLDSCSPLNPLRQTSLPDIVSIKDAKAKFLSKYESLAIVVHDSAKCEAFDFKAFFKDSGLKKWPDINFRTPYIGIISKNSDVVEYSGASETTLLVNIGKEFPSTPKKDSIVNAFISWGHN